MSKYWTAAERKAIERKKFKKTILELRRFFRRELEKYISRNTPPPPNEAALFFQKENAA